MPTARWRSPSLPSDTSMVAPLDRASAWAAVPEGAAVWDAVVRGLAVAAEEGLVVGAVAVADYSPEAGRVVGPVVAAETAEVMAMVGATEAEMETADDRR